MKSISALKGRRKSSLAIRLFNRPSGALTYCGLCSGGLRHRLIFSTPPGSFIAGLDVEALPFEYHEYGDAELGWLLILQFYDTSDHPTWLRSVVLNRMMNRILLSMVLWVFALSAGFMAGRMIFADGPWSESDSSGKRAAMRGGITSESGNGFRERPPKSGTRALGGIESSDFEDLVHFIFSDHENPRASKEWWEFVKGLDSRGIGEVMDRITREGYSSEMLPYFLVVWKKWAELDPMAALDKARDPGGLSFQSDPNYSDWATMVVLMDWSEKDPFAAVQWMESNPEATVASRRALHVVMYSLAYADEGGEQAASLLREISNASNRTSAIQSFVEHYGTESGFEDVLSWGVSLQDEGLRGEALLAIASQAEDYEQTERIADWLLENRPEGKLSLISKVLEEMSRRDLSLAIDYLNEIEDEAMKRSAFAGLVAHGGADRDPSVLLALMDSNPSMYGDETAEKFIEGAFNQNRPVAMSGINRIKDDQRRNDAYRKHMLAWLADDYEAAMEWAGSNGMPEAVEVMMRDLLRTEDP